MKIIMTIIGCAVAGGLCFFAFIYSGVYDVSALEPDSAFVRWAAHTTSDRSVGARLKGLAPPAGNDEPRSVQAGGRIYAQNCVMCHGGPGLKPTAVAMGLNPAPPANFFTAGRTPWPEEMFRFIKHGVKMTAMPGFAPSYADNEIWSIVAFLRTAPGMSPEKFSSLTGLDSTIPLSIKPTGG